ncbi:MAG: hypothetical protein SGCHY_005648, partial [Lobulomycetales sp.]
IDPQVFKSDSLNPFMALGKPAWSLVRSHLQQLIKADSLPVECKIPLSEAVLHMPCKIGDYTDFYASKEHATNVGTMFRGKDNALMPNWTRLPVGYHGRASSVVVSGTDLVRPSGQILDPTTKQPYFSPSKKVFEMDFELEVAFIVGVGNELGSPIPVEKADDHIFGMVLMNDWSARDIQVWEYVPLGPFLGKNFGTTISPWIVTMEALEAFRTPQPVQDPAPMAYLDNKGKPDAYDVELSVEYNGKTVCRSNLKYMYWSFAQQLAHHTVNGCNVRTGDLMGSGTISGPTEDSYGSLLELSWNGSKKLMVGKNGDEERTFIQDGDEIVVRGVARGKDFSLGFGEARGKILASRSSK